MNFIIFLLQRFFTLIHSITARRQCAVANQRMKIAVGPRQQELVVSLIELRHAEINNINLVDIACAHQDVGRLEIGMHDPFSVQRLQHLDWPQREIEYNRRWHRPVKRKRFAKVSVPSTKGLTKYVLPSQSP